MNSLYDSLLAQHPRQLTPIRCSQFTVTQLHRYFEEVVLENSLGALVVESVRQGEECSARKSTHIRELVQAAQNLFLFVGTNDALSRPVTRGKETREPTVLELKRAAVHERFIVIADPRFSAVLACSTACDRSTSDSGDLVWTFEPEIVFTALEHLMGRIKAEYPAHAASFAEAMRLATPSATSLQLTLGITTKLARLLQEQAQREIAVSRIAAAIRNSLELDSLLATVADEVGRSLNAKSCAVQVEGDLVEETKCSYYFRSEPYVSEEERSALSADVELIRACLPNSPRTWLIDGDNTHETGVCAQAAVPLMYEGSFVGLLLVESDDAARVWGDNELLLLHTVADQLTVAVRQVHLFSQMQVQALTDWLTGCYNRRSFELQLERDLHLATRMRQPLSLIMIDLDDFKHINDGAGHATGDVALRTVADNLRAELRAEDSAARFGGDEFAIILPQADASGAMVVAERLRRRIATTNIPGYGPITASFGLASFPVHASSRDHIVVAADRALYRSKHLGRNCVSLPPVDFHTIVTEDNNPALEPAETLQSC